jgi:3-dehydroquinate synthetase
MVAEAQLAERMAVAQAGLAELIAGVLSGLGLPVRIPAEISPVEVIRAMRVDKKKDGHAVRFALPVRIGEVQVGVAVDDLEQVFAEA